MTTVHDETALYAEVRRLYVIDALSDPEAATRYMRALEDVDSALLFISQHMNAWTGLTYLQEKEAFATLDKLEQEGWAFSKKEKEKGRDVESN
jgi:hypothetical protein